MRLEQVQLLSAGLEGLVTGSIAATFSVTFFDTQFATHRSFYSAHRQYEFVLAGLAYTCRNRAARQMGDSGVPQIRQAHARIAETVVDGKMQPDMSGVTMLTEAGGGQGDDYLYRGPVTEVIETQLLGQPMRRLRVTVARDADTGKSIDIAIYVPQRTLEGQAPKVGDEVEGFLCLQGYLWSPVPYHDFPWAIATEAGLFG